MYKVITYCQKEDIDKLINAMSEKGAGRVGSYTHCAFITKGEGNWYSESGANPSLGEAGKMTRVEEYRIEMICPEEALRDVIKSIKETHTYEEPEINIIRLETP